MGTTDNYVDDIPLATLVGNLRAFQWKRIRGRCLSVLLFTMLLAANVLANYYFYVSMDFQSQVAYSAVLEFTNYTIYFELNRS